MCRHGCICSHICISISICICIFSCICILCPCILRVNYDEVRVTKAKRATFRLQWATIVYVRLLLGEFSIETFSCLRFCLNAATISFGFCYACPAFVYLCVRARNCILKIQSNSQYDNTTRRYAARCPTVPVALQFIH